MTLVPSEPTRFGKYQIIERIASGGMAEVFKARLDGIGGFHRTYAIKRILPHLTSNAEFVDLLVDEAKVAGLLSHANIVQILDLGAVDGQYFIAMEYVNGKDLRQILERCAAKNITLPFPHAVYTLIEMLKGLEYAHDRTVVRNGKQVPLNIVHRDISPANLLVSYQGEIKLTDFGIAKAIVKGMETQAGVVKGRFDYMAPEQAAGGHVDHRADLFAAGVVFYELLTGRHPFRQAADLKTLDAVRRGEVIPPSRINPDVPAALDAVVAAALQVDPDRRYASATLFKDALNQFFHDAGFIFSAATLATFVRGLFPPEEAKPVPPDAPKPAMKTADQDTGPIARPWSRSEAPRSEAPRSEASRSEASQMVSRAAMVEDATLIRKPEFEAIEPAPASQWSDLETVIRPDPFAVRGPAAAPPLPPSTLLPRTGPARALPPPSIGRPAAGRVESKPLSQPVEPRRLVPDPRGMDGPRGVDGPRRVDVPVQGRMLTESKARVVYRTANHVHLVYVALCFAALVAGLGCGVLLGRSAGAQPVVLDAAPAAEIHAPVGSTAWLDGKPLVGVPPWRVTLAAGVPAVVRVQGPGFGPIDAPVQLPANQMRVLDFTPLASAKVP